MFKTRFYPHAFLKKKLVRILAYVFPQVDLVRYRNARLRLQHRKTRPYITERLFM